MSASSLFRLHNQMQSVMNDMNALLSDPFYHHYHHAFAPVLSRHYQPYHHRHHQLLDDDDIIMHMEPLFSPTLLASEQQQQLLQQLQQQQQQQNPKEGTIPNAAPSSSSLSVPSQSQSLSLSPWGTFMQCHCDVHEDKEKFVITAELPGMSKESVKVELHDAFLTISGSKKEELSNDSDNLTNDGVSNKNNNNNVKTIRRSERRYGSFTRSFRLPSSCYRDDVNKVNAKYENGVLTISVPKKEETAAAAATPTPTQVVIQ